MRGTASTDFVSRCSSTGAKPLIVFRSSPTYDRRYTATAWPVSVRMPRRFGRAPARDKTPLCLQTRWPRLRHALRLILGQTWARHCLITVSLRLAARSMGIGVSARESAHVSRGFALGRRGCRVGHQWSPRAPACLTFLYWRRTCGDSRLYPHQTHDYHPGSLDVTRLRVVPTPPRPVAPGRTVCS